MALQYGADSLGTVDAILHLCLAFVWLRAAPSPKAKVGSGKNCGVRAQALVRPTVSAHPPLHLAPFLTAPSLECSENDWL